MSATVTHPDIATTTLMQVLTDDSELMNIEITMNGEPEKIQGVHYMKIQQEVMKPYPAIIVNQPITHDFNINKSPNGPQEISIADFLQTIRFAVRDVEPRDPQLLAMRARGLALLIGKTITVGSEWICSFIFHDWLIDKLQDDGTYIYSEIGFILLGCVSRI
jgi:hypothetical protein